MRPEAIGVTVATATAASRRGYNFMFCFLFVQAEDAFVMESDCNLVERGKPNFVVFWKEFENERILLL